MAVINRDDLATALGVELRPNNPRLDHVDRLRTVCLSLIERYAPSAPDEIKSEALLRLAGYLDSARGEMGIYSEIEITSGSGAAVDLRFRSACQSAMRCSGAASLLSLWRVRRAVRAVAS